MRRMFLIAVASCAVLAIAPATALAHGRHHHHARFHHKRFFGDQAQSASQNAPAATATVVSFTNGVLTIKANDGNTASGTVTDNTDLVCITPGQTGMWSRNRNWGGGGGWDQGGNDQGDDDNGPNQACSTSALVPGAMVQSAVLGISNAGATWFKVELIAQPSSSTSTTTGTSGSQCPQGAAAKR
ncbi:MAG TPA: hypothetical protein VMB27_02260 [Solirubrobacteraceae bacterium]|nr:hypothetical protein [Solirubrobacteraceae bacterium]